MKKFWTAISTVLLMGGGVFFLFTTEATMQNDNLADIARGNMAEIEASNLALQRAQNEQVRHFAQQLVTDHTAAANELQTLATSKNLTLPAAMTDKQRSDMTKLGGGSGADFDRDYMKMMVKDHDRMAKMLSREADRNADADVKAFAARTLPVVQGHLTMARSLSDSLKGNGNGGNGTAGAGSNSNRSTSRSTASNSNRSDNNSSMDTNMNSNMNMNTNSTRTTNTNRGNTNTNRTNTNRGNSNTNSNSNSNSNTNSNSNNSNVNRM